MQSTLKLSITPELSALNSALDKVNKRALGIGDALDKSLKNATAALKQELSKSLVGPKLEPKALKEMEKQIKKASVAKLELDTKEACNRVLELRGQILGTIGSLYAAIYKPISKAMDFEASFAMVKKVVDFTGDEAIKIQKEIWKLTKEVPLAAGELTEIMASGGQLGLDKKLLVPFTDVVSKMAFAFDIGAKEAGDTIAGIMAKLDVGIDEVRELGDAMNYLGNNSSAVPKEIAEILNRTAGLVKTLKLSAREGVALSAAFANMKIPAEQAGTAINKMLNVLGSPDVLTDRAKDALNQLGIDIEDLKEAMAKSPFDAIRNVLGAVAGADDGEKIGILKNLFGEEAAPKIAQITSNLKAFDKIYKMTMDRPAQKNSMENEVATLKSTTQGALKSLTSSLDNIFVSIGSVFLPQVAKIFEVLSKLSTAIANFAQENQTLVKVLGYTFTAITGFKVLHIGITLLKAFSLCLLLPTRIMLVKFIPGLASGTTALKLFNLWTKITSIGLKALGIASLVFSRIFAGAMFGFIKITRIASLAIMGFSKIFSISLKTMKIALITSGIGAIILIISEAIELIYNNWDSIAPKLVGVWEWIKSKISPVIDWFAWVFSFLGKGFDRVIEGASKIASAIGLDFGESKADNSIKLAGLSDEVKSSAEVRRDRFIKEQAMHINNAKTQSIVDNKTIYINTTASAKDIDNVLRANSYTYLD